MIIIQVVNVESIELEHVYSIIVKIEDKSAQFDVEGMFTNLSDTAQEELVVLFQSKYSL